MQFKFLTILAATAVATQVLADDHASGDAEAGEKTFRQCKACHMIVDDDGNNIVRGGRVGPNLYGVVGRVAGSVEDFRYSGLLEAAGEQGLEWDEESFVGYVQDPTGWLQDYTGEDGRGKMSYQVRKAEDAVNVWAYLASVGPDEAM
ncbi:cytochrome C [Roseovarius gahaiensis]|uniref:Cytochrome C n=1 Tax=Roseovarius gahaiensis TaxID=2716691 RepID=A0A967EGR5_9RHOB|nr:cytochrome C [Roseovarius gahaiensis]NHQ74945.1 cytochrome C [Roseovarius gahaiensis]